MKTQTRKGEPCIIVHYFCEGHKLYKEWIMKKNFNRASFYRRNVIEEIKLDFSKSKTFPRIHIEKSSLRNYIGNECIHHLIDGDISESIYYCEECGEEIY